MKEKIEKLDSLYREIKKHCYDLCVKWSEYRKSLDPVITDYECSIYDYKNMDINELYFEFYTSINNSELIFQIGYEYVDRCGDTDSFYTHFKTEELYNEDLIKDRIDKIHKNKIDAAETKRLEEEKKKEKAAKIKEEWEYQEYLRLQEKYKNKK